MPISKATPKCRRLSAQAPTPGFRPDFHDGVLAMTVLHIEPAGLEQINLNARVGALVPFGAARPVHETGRRNA